MPIYCLNGAKSTRKRSKNIIHELINANNYYMNGSSTNGNGGFGGNTSVCISQQHQSHPNKSSHQQKCSAPSSLIMAINRLKHSTKDMKETVLIPTRLSDLVTHQPSINHDFLPPNPGIDLPLSISDLMSGADSDSVTDCRSDSSSSGCSSSSLSLISCGSSSSASASNLNLNFHNQHTISCLGDLNHFMALSMNSHNLYEQYKLVDLIDKIVSCDTILTVSNGINAGNFYNQILGVGGCGGGNTNVNGHGNGYHNGHHLHHPHSHQLSHNQNHKRQFSNGNGNLNGSSANNSNGSSATVATSTTDNDDNNNSKHSNNNNNNNNMSTTTTTTTATGKVRTSQNCPQYQQEDNQNGKSNEPGHFNSHPHHVHAHSHSHSHSHPHHAPQHNNIDHINGFRNGARQQRQPRPTTNGVSKFDSSATTTTTDPTNYNEDSDPHSAIVSAANGDACCSNGGNLITNCSLLMIKENFEYHLNGLKEILNLMSNSAEYITQKYLEDIHCEDRFDRQVKSKCDQNESIRHYHTGNNNISSSGLSTGSSIGHH